MLLKTTLCLLFLIACAYGSKLFFPIEDCNCENGVCVKGGEECECLPEYGRYSKNVCKPCNCGPDTNCTFTRNILRDIVNCICKENYIKEGRKCIGPCSDYPCKNDGKCKDVKDGYECHCKKGYLGRNCEVRDACSLRMDLCLNNGTCTATGHNKYKCNCKSPYWGPKCEKDPCTNINCQNNGTCSFDEEIFKCSCKEPYFGKECEKDPCTNINCQNNGTCGFDGENFKCSCKKPYFGKECEKDPCTYNPCRNNGICKFEEDGFKCICKEPFFGKTCGNDPCIHKPCRNNGTCSFEENKFKCNCKKQFSGIYCEKEVCSLKSCKHGRCEIKEDVFLCKCDEGYSGVNCDIKIVTEKDDSNGVTIFIVALTSSLLLFFSIVFIVRLLVRKSTIKIII